MVDNSEKNRLGTTLTAAIDQTCEAGKGPRAQATKDPSAKKALQNLSRLLRFELYFQTHRTRLNRLLNYWQIYRNINFKIANMILLFETQVYEGNRPI